MSDDEVKHYIMGGVHARLEGSLEDPIGVVEVPGLQHLRAWVCEAFQKKVHQGRVA